MSSVESRIVELEMRSAYHDKTIAELNDVIMAQWKKIESLERQVQRLGDEMAALDAGDAPVQQKPPHY